MTAAFAPVTAAQTAALVGLWESCGVVRPWNPPAEDIADLRDNPTSEILVAAQGGRIVASVGVGYDGHRGWVYYVATAPDRRRQGLGRAAMAAAEAWLVARGARKLQLMVRESNAAVMGFYAALGYEDAKVRVLARWLDPGRDRLFRESLDDH